MKQILLMFGVLAIVSTITFAQEDYKVYDEGVTKFKAGDYDAVITDFSRILSDPKHNKRLDDGLYFYRGQSYYFKNDYSSSVNDLDKALEMDHYQKGTIYMFKARCSDKKGNKPEAEEFYAKALSLSESNKKVTAQILADRASFYQRHGNTASAQEDLVKAKSLDPSVQQLAYVTPKTAPKDDKTTQVIVRPNNSSAKQTPTQKTTTPAAAKDTKKEDTKSKSVPQDQPSAESASSSVAVVSALADTYKDEKRYALVIGNSNYNKEIGSLKNPVNDATDVATELRKSQFDVQLLTNATYIQIREAMRKFQERLTNGPKDQTVGLFYYAGHGVQYQDENYLVPIDANVAFEDDIVRMCFPVQRMVLNNMENTNSRMNIIILDACRNNPFPATTRSVEGGLAEMKRARGSFIAYATAPGSVASDGSGRNGLYTQELLKALRKPGLTIEQVFKLVRMNVLKLSGDRQYTWDSSNIIGEFYFKF